MKKRNFSAEFRRESAQLVVDQNYTVADAAKAMSVGLSILTRWVKQLRDEQAGKTPKASPITPEQIKIRELKKKIQRIEMENEILKKATVDSIGHRSNYRYRENRPDKPDGRRAVLRSQVQELHGLSYGSAGVRSIAVMATRRGFRMGRWLMKEMGQVRCQQPVHRYKRGGHEHIESPWV